MKQITHFFLEGESPSLRVHATFFKYQNPLVIRLLTRLRIGLSHLNQHRFIHNFDNCINILCTWVFEIESIIQFFLHCHFYNNICQTLLDDLNVINTNILFFSKTVLTDLLLYGRSILEKFQNKISTASIKYLVDSERFTGSIFQHKKLFYYFCLLVNCWSYSVDILSLVFRLLFHL